MDSKTIGQRGVALAALLLWSAGARGQSVMWDGDAGDGFWTTASNWDTDQVPGLNSQVTIPGDAGVVTIELALAAIGSVDCQSGLRLNAGSLDVMSTSSVMNLTVEGPFNPTITTDGAFTISGNGDVGTLTLEGLGSFSNAGTLDAFGVGVDGLGVNNPGTWNMTPSSGYISLNSDAVLTNSGTITMLNSCTIDSTGTLMNTGTIRRTGGQGFASISSRFMQTSGSLVADGMGANLSIDGDAWNLSGGTISVLNNAQIDFSGSNASGTRSLGLGTISGNGTVGLFAQNTTMNLPSAITLNVNGGGVGMWSGTFNIGGVLTNSGLLELRGALLSGSGSAVNNSGALVSLPSGNAADIRVGVDNKGTIDLRGGLYLSDHAELKNSSTGSLLLRVDSFVSTQTAMMNGTVDNFGVVRLLGNSDGPVVPIQTRLVMRSSSKLEAMSGTISLEGGGTLSGGELLMKGEEAEARVVIDGVTSTVYQISGMVTIDEQFGSSHGAKFVIGSNNASSDPQLNFGAGGVMTIDDKTSAELVKGRMLGSGKLVNEGEITWIGGVIENLVENNSEFYITSGFGKTLKGTVTQSSLFDFVYQSGGFTMQDGATINNGANWVLTSGASILSSGLANTLHNTDAFGVDDPAMGSSLIEVDFNNTGTVNAIRGHLAFTGNVLQLDMDGTLSGGTWIAGSESSISFPRSLVRLNGPGKIVGGTAEFPDMASLTSMGEQASAELLDSMFTNDLTISDGVEMTVDGDVTINGEFKSTGGSRTTINPGKKLEASGGVQVGELDSAADDIAPIAVIAREGVAVPSIVTPMLELWGGIRVGESGSAEILIDCDVLMQPTARVHVTMVGDQFSNTIDRLDVDGSVILDGELVIDASGGGFALGETRTVLTATGTIGGVFDRVRVVGLGINQTMVADIVGNQVQVTAALGCTADLNSDMQLNFLDVSMFLQLYGAGDLIADLNGDGSLNFLDVSAFLGAYGAGCP